MEVSVLRAGSRGINGTFENIGHHAPAAEPTVKRLVSLVEEHKKTIKSWKQGHNIHIVETMDGRSLSFRPFMSDRWSDNGVTGVEVSLKISRSVEIKLMKIETVSEFAAFALFFEHFLYPKLSINCYGMDKKDHKEI